MTENFFHFNDTDYLQIHGTTMSFQMGGRLRQYCRGEGWTKHFNPNTPKPLI